MPAPSGSPEKQLAGFIDKFSPDMAAFIRAARKKMRERLPSAIELVYDNYNFFVIGYGPSERASEAIFSLACHARGVTLCFLQGAGLPDPKKILRGSGSTVRNIRLQSASTLDESDVRTLMKHALDRAKVPVPAKGAHVLVIKSISAKQRPRRVEGAGAKPVAKPRAAVGRSTGARAAKPRAGNTAARKESTSRKR